MDKAWNSYMRLVRLALLSFALLSTADVVAEALAVPEKADSLPLLTYIQFKPETPDMLGKSPREIDASSGWQSAQGDLDFGFTSTAYWFRFSLRTARARRIVLMADAAISRLVLYKLNGGASHQNGDTDESHDLSLEARANPDVVRHRRPAVELELSPGETRILLRMQNEQLSRMPLTLWDARTFYEFRTGETLIFGLFFGAVGAIALYNLLMFVSTRETPYGVYVFYAAMALCYSAAFQGFHIVLLPWLGEYWLVRSVILFVCLFGAGMNWFAQSFLQTRIHAPGMNRLHIGLALLATATGVLSTLPFLPAYPLLHIIAGLAILTVASMLASGWIVWKRGFKPARFYVLAIALFVLGAFANSLRIWGVIPHSFWIQHGVQAGIFAEMILLSLALSDRINTLKRSLEKNLSEIALAREVIATSEKKYRVLVEDTSDLIFSTDLSGRILSMNHASRKLLGHSPAELRGQFLYSLLHEAARESQGYDLMRLRDAVQQIGNSALQTRVRFSSKTGEPVSLALRLERIGTEAGEGIADGLILGKASLDMDDVLAPCVTAEHGSYTIENYLSLSDLVHQRITRSLTRYFDRDSCDEITMVLREMLINAIEHGNLEITYQEKTDAQRDGTYMQLIRERQKVEPFKSRRVKVEFSLNQRRIWFRISDEGHGFDHEAMRIGEEQRLRSLQESHGRGIALARVLFDLVRYNAKGNSVVLAKLTGKGH